MVKNGINYWFREGGKQGCDNAPDVQQQVSDDSVNNMTGNGVLNLSNFAFSNTLFAVSVSGLVVQPKELESLYISFTPKDTTAVNAQLTITTNDPNKKTSVVKLSGKGVLKGNPTLVLDKEKLDFGFVPLGASGTKTLIVSNGGEDVLKLSSISATSTLFQVTPGTAEVAAGEQKSIKVTFTPVDEVATTATLNITNNSSNKPSASISLLGSSIRGTSITPSVSVSSAELNFGQVFVGMLGHGKHVGKDLGRVEFICQAVPYRHTGVFGKGFHGCLVKAAVFYAVVRTSENSCGILHRLLMSDV